MSEFETRLNQARKGGGILFCGAGFTADCLNFDDREEIGVGAHLLRALNSLLKDAGATHNFKSVQNAAGEFIKLKGEHGLMNFLCERFRLQKVSEAMVDIINFPWDRVYTTNYDNGIELSMQCAEKKAKPVNNLEPTEEAEGEHAIVHLHGYIDKWDIKNFKNSCVLDASSYLRLSAVSKWLPHFRDDIHRAQFVVFVGFNAADFHLNQVIFDISSLREKMFFINRPSAAPDPDVKATQELFGTPLYVGRTGFAGRIRSSLASDLPIEPKLASFKPYVSVAPSMEVPKVDDIENLFLFGNVVRKRLANDVANKMSGYHVRRDFIDELKQKIQNGVRVLLVTGEICDGKTLALECLCEQLAITRPVYVLHHPYEDLLDEVSRIVDAYPNAAFLVENCFDLRSNRLASLARLCSGSDGVLLLSSRNIVAEAETEQLTTLKKLLDFAAFQVPHLNEQETRALVGLVDQFAGWRDFNATTEADKIRFVSKTCAGSLPAFQLRLLKSKYVKEKYQEEYNKSADLSQAERQAIIVALYFGHIGHDSPNRVLSDAFGFDVGGLADQLQRRPDGLKLIHRSGNDFIRTVPAIGATNILEHMIPDRDIVDSVIAMLSHLAEPGIHTDFEQYIFGQLMRYSILKSVVGDKVHVNRFFDNISKIDYFRRQILFWLQWHIAKVDQDDFSSAEKYLDNGYAEAVAYERRSGRSYDRKQLEDRTAKFLMLRAQKRAREPDELFRDFKEAWEIVGRLLRKEVVTHHTFETLEMIAEAFNQKEQVVAAGLRGIARKSIVDAMAAAERQVEKVSPGYQRTAADKALSRCQSLLLKK